MYSYPIELNNIVELNNMVKLYTMVKYFNYKSWTLTHIILVAYGQSKLELISPILKWKHINLYLTIFAFSVAERYVKKLFIEHRSTKAFQINQIKDDKTIHKDLRKCIYFRNP